MDTSGRTESPGDLRNSFSFPQLFRALTGYDPFPWQVQLYECLVAGDIPVACSIPTGLGKTAIIPIWLIALANRPDRVPRKLVYIINRRTVVDQATSIAEVLRQRICDSNSTGSDSPLAELRERLRNLCAFKECEVLAISTLRGELADNQAWKQDPTRPAIIIGTIDMVGSKLLFQGYGDGRYGRVHHAGLLGQDSLIVHDEAHLTPAFSYLLRAIENEQENEQAQDRSLKRIRVLDLSATLVKSTKGRPINECERGGKVIKLKEEDLQSQEVRDRFFAKKRLYLQKVGKGEVVEQIVELAQGYGDKQLKVLIYVTRVEDARKIATKLKGKFNDSRVKLLTGTLRGYERDRLLSDSVLKGFLSSESVPESIFLVSTSAGEVGVDLDADCMIMDLTTLDAMIQRLGRVNRRGKGDARIDLVIENSSEEKGVTDALENTLRLIERLSDGQGGYDVSPRALSTLLDELSEDEKLAAFQARPEPPHVTSIHFDAWSMTSIDGDLYGRPQVAEFLHGLTETEEAETWVAWRKEVALFAKYKSSPDLITEWFAECRLLSHELLRDVTSRVVKHLEKIYKPDKITHAVLLDESGQGKLIELKELFGEREDLRFKTLVLPPEAGGLDENGILDGSCTSEVLDVAEKNRVFRSNFRSQTA